MGVDEAPVELQALLQAQLDHVTSELMALHVQRVEDRRLLEDQRAEIQRQLQEHQLALERQRAELEAGFQHDTAEFVRMNAATAATAAVPDDDDDDDALFRGIARERVRNAAVLDALESASKAHNAQRRMQAREHGDPSSFIPSSGTRYYEALGRRHP